MSTFLTSRKALKTTAMALALVAATSMTAAPAFAGGHHGGGWGGGGGSYHGGGYHGGYHGGGHDDGLAAVALIGGVILGAAFMSAATQPAYVAPQPAYAPAPAYYNYNQTPVQAVPTSDVYQAQSGQYCREYQSQARIGGVLQTSYGTACQQPDGSWRVVN